MSNPRCGPERACCGPCLEQTLFTVGIGHQAALHLGSVVSTPTDPLLEGARFRSRMRREESVAPTATKGIHQGRGKNAVLDTYATN